MLSSSQLLIRINKHGEQTTLIRAFTIFFHPRQRLIGWDFCHPTHKTDCRIVLKLCARYSSDILSVASRIKILWNCHAAFEAYVPLLNALRFFIYPHLSSFAEELSCPDCTAVMNSKEKHPQGEDRMDSNAEHYFTVCAEMLYANTLPAVKYKVLGMQPSLSLIFRDILHFSLHLYSNLKRWGEFKWRDVLSQGSVPPALSYKIVCSPAELPLHVCGCNGCCSFSISVDLEAEKATHQLVHSGWEKSSQGKGKRPTNKHSTPAWGMGASEFRFSVRLINRVSQ